MQKQKKWSALPLKIAMAGIGLLVFGWALLLIFWHLSREKAHVDSQVRTGTQILATLDSTDIALQALASEGAVRFFSPEILSGWAAQVHSEIESVSGLPFSWTSSDRVLIDRLDRAWASLFRTIQISGAEHQTHLFGTVHEIILTRQAISRKASHMIRRLEKVSLGLSGTLILIEAGIVCVGIIAFILFSLAMYFFRRTVNSLDRLSVAKFYLSAILEAVPTALFLKDSDGRWLRVNKAALDLFGLESGSWENRTDQEISRENPFYQEVFSACQGLDREALEKNEKTLSVESVRTRDGRTLKMEVTRIPLGNPDGTPMGIVVSSYDMTERIRKEEEILRLKAINEVLSDVDEFILGVPEAPFLFDFVCEAISSRLRALLTCWIGTFNPDGTLGQNAFCGAPGESPELVFGQDFWGKMEKRLSMEVVEPGKIRGWTDLFREEPGHFPPQENSGGNHPLRSIVSVPFFREGQVAGLMCLSSLEGEIFSPEIVRLLESIARSISFALDNLEREKKRTLSDESREQISSLYEALSRINRLTAEVPAPEVLYRETVRIAVETADLALGWIGLLGESQKLEFVGVEGRAKDYVDDLVISTDPDTPEGRGPGGQALRSGDPVISDFSSDPDFAPWRHKAERFGLSSSANFSFSRGGKVIGAMGLYHDRLHSFFPEQIALFRQFASTLTFALDNWDREKLRKASEAEMALAASVALNTHEGVVIADPDRSILSMNRAFTHLTGLSEQESGVTQLESLPLRGNGKEFWKSILPQAILSGSFRGEVSIMTREKVFLPEIMTVSVVRDPNGVPTHYVVVFTDISQIKDEQIKLEYLSLHDPLTGLPNRRAFGDRVEKGLKVAKRSNSRLGVAILDMDGFKNVNDRFGHDAGDRFLVEVSSRMKAVLRENDTLARLGGDEFGLLVEGIGTSSEIGDILERFIAALKFSFCVDEYAITLTGSIGIAVYPEDGEDPQTLLSHADLALYQAKEKGKNRWMAYEPSLQENLDRTARVRGELKLALETPGELVLHYQPQVNLRTGKILGFEALLRWNHPVKGVIFPEEFIEIVETDAPLISRLGGWVLSEALSQIEKWGKLGRSYSVLVNVGGLHFLNPGFLEQWNTLWSDFPGVSRSDLRIGISESAAIRDVATSLFLIEALRNGGTEVVLCSFGSVSSSLTALGRLPVSGIAIDRHLTRTLLTGPSSIAVVSGILAMARTLNRDLLLSGIESIEQGILFMAAGGSHAQGYAAGLPMDPGGILDWSESFALPGDWRFWSELSWPQNEMDLLRGALEEKRRFRQWSENPAAAHEYLHETGEKGSFWEDFIAGEGRERFDGRPEFLEIQKISDHLHESIHSFRSINPEKAGFPALDDLLSGHREMIRLLGALVSQAGFS